MKIYYCNFFTKILLILFLDIISITSLFGQTGQDKSNSITCNTVDCIRNAMANAQPGDEIQIESGIYEPQDKLSFRGKASRFGSQNDGTATNPIILKAKDPANPPVLKGPDQIYDGYALHILGDYWHIKDIIFEEGSKGIVFDNANNGIIENVIVRELGEEGIHLRDGSSANLVKNCSVYNVGIKKPGIGEGLYVGSDKNQHAGPGDENDTSKYNPDCNDNVIEGCTIGPNVTAEGADIKEGTKNTVIRNCTFSAEGISGENSADAFIDLKGAYGFVYNNTFNLDGSTIINAGVDFLDRGTGYNTGYRNAIFNNIFNLESRGDEIQTARKKQGNPSEIYVWDNTRSPNTPDFPISDGSLGFITQSCPSWNIIPCEETENQAPIISFISPTSNLNIVVGYESLSVEVSASDPDGNIANVTLYINNNIVRQINQPPYQWGIGEHTNELLGLTEGNYTIKAEATDNEGKTAEVTFTLTISTENTGEETDCSFGTPSSNPLPDYNEASFSNVHVLGSGGPDVSNIDRFRITWDTNQNQLNRFAINTTDGVPDFYIDLRDAMEFSFNSAQPELTLSNSGISGWDGSYWVTSNGDNFVMVSKNNGFTLYFNNEINAPNCEDTLSNPDFNNPNQQITVYPNPIEQKYLHLAYLPKEETVIKVVDMLGKTILSKKLDLNDPKIDISTIANGTYILLIKGIKFETSKLFMKR